LRRTGSSYSTYLRAKLVITQVIAGKDIVPSDGMLRVFQAGSGISRMNLLESKHEKSFFAVRLVPVYGSPSFAQMWD
jgi:hypothetical protein